MYAKAVNKAAPNIDPVVAYNCLVTLKDMFKAGRAKVCKLPHHGKVLIYPQDPLELETSDPEVFKIMCPEGHALAPCLAMSLVLKALAMEP